MKRMVWRGLGTGMGGWWWCAAHYDKDSLAIQPARTPPRDEELFRHVRSERECRQK
jgi:hypothetical protein